MKTKGISLIILVITVLVLAILATTVIISLSNTNIIEQAGNAVKENNLQTMKEAVNLQVLSHMAKHNGNVVPSELLTELNTEFNSKGYTATEKYGIITILDTAHTMTIEVFNKGIVTGMLGEDPYANLQIGDVVEYTPVPGSYTVKASVNMDEENNYNSVKGAQTFSTTAVELANLKWIYIGRDETTGKHLITTENLVDKSVALYGKGSLAIEANGKEAAVNELNKLCEALYSSGNKKARSMTIEDVNRILEYTGPKGLYYNTDNSQGTEPKTFSAIAKENDNYNISSWSVPSTKLIGDYVSNYYSISNSSADINADRTGLIYKSKAYWLASSCADAWLNSAFADFRVRFVNSSGVNAYYLFDSHGGEQYYSNAVRPVVSL